MRHAGGARREAREVVEKVLGKPLPSFAVIHHIDGNESNNSHLNLIVCEDQKYHLLLHRRMNALEACGHADWRKCNYCKKYDNPKNLYVSPDERTVQHPDCRRKVRGQKKRATGTSRHRSTIWREQRRILETTNQFLIGLGEQR